MSLVDNKANDFSWCSSLMMVLGNIDPKTLSSSKSFLIFSIFREKKSPNEFAYSERETCSVYAVSCAGFIIVMKQLFLVTYTLDNLG